MFYLYVLIDPRNKQVRYIGQTNCIDRRYKRHLVDARNGSMFHCHRWIRTLLAELVKPIMHTIATYPTLDEVNQGETYWIAEFHRCKFELTNKTSGGGGRSGYHLSDASKDNLREKALARNAALTPEQRSARSRKANASMTAEARSERARKANASVAPEIRSERSRKANASKTPEQRKNGVSDHSRKQSTEHMRNLNASLSVEERRQRSQRAGEGNRKKSPAARSEIARKRMAALTPEQRTARGKKIWETRCRNRGANPGSVKLNNIHISQW